MNLGVDTFSIQRFAIASGFLTVCQERNLFDTVHQWLTASQGRVILISFTRLELSFAASINDLSNEESPDVIQRQFLLLISQQKLSAPADCTIALNWFCIAREEHSDCQTERTSWRCYFFGELRLELMKTWWSNPYPNDTPKYGHVDHSEQHMTLKEVCLWVMIHFSMTISGR